MNDDNLLAASGLPTFFEVVDVKELGLSFPDNRRGQTVRTWARSLSVMQKEAIVLSVRSGKAWRLASDEGPYLNGHDAAPCPLSFMTTGMVASYMTEIRALAVQRNVRIRDIVLVQNNYYTMEGSALRGTMMGGALPVDLEVSIGCDADDNTLNKLLVDAVAASPLNGLLRGVHDSIFTLTLNSTTLDVDSDVVVEPASELTNGFGAAKPASADYSETVQRVSATDEISGVAGGAGSSLQSSQSRTLHVRGTCRVLEDGTKEIVQELFSPMGSTFRFLCDESDEFGGAGRAPDAATYVAAGIAFCFMTQLGRYAKIVKRGLDSYRVVQDAHFAVGGASGGTNAAGRADAVETHVFLDTQEGEAFARELVKMGEQTCFLHALCRTDLKTKLRIHRQ